MDPHHFGKLDPDPHQCDAERIRLVFLMKYIKVRFLNCSTGSGSRIPRRAVAVSRIRIRMDPHHFGKLDPDPHQCDADPSHLSHEVH